MNIDWSKSPAGTTHWAPESEDFHESWYKQVGSSWFCTAVGSYREFRSGWYGLGCQFHREGLVARPTFREILREHESGDGFTFTTQDPKSAFAMAEKMVFSGKRYAISLSGVKGGEWTVVVTEKPL